MPDPRTNGPHPPYYVTKIEPCIKEVFELSDEEVKELAFAPRRRRPEPEPEIQTHTHEFQASTELAEPGEDRHNHRFAGVTTEEIPVRGSHVHGFSVNTDFLDHHHEVTGLTGLAIEVSPKKHVHFAEGITTENDEHVHGFQFATLIESPLLKPCPPCGHEDHREEEREEEDEEEHEEEHERRKGRR